VIWGFENWKQVAYLKIYPQIYNLVAWTRL